MARKVVFFFRHVRNESMVLTWEAFWNLISLFPPYRRYGNGTQPVLSSRSNKESKLKKPSSPYGAIGSPSEGASYEAPTPVDEADDFKTSHLSRSWSVYQNYHDLRYCSIVECVFFLRYCSIVEPGWRSPSRPFRGRGCGLQRRRNVIWESSSTKCMKDNYHFDLW